METAYSDLISIIYRTQRIRLFHVERLIDLSQEKGLLVPSLPAAEPVEAIATVPQAQTEDQHPFTHLAYIPADAELGTIRLEGVSRVHVPSWIMHTADANYCAEAAFRDPGGSAFCPSTGGVVSAVAYQVTYS